MIGTVFTIRSALRLLGVLTPLAVGVVCGKLLTPFLPQFAVWIATIGPWAPVVFVAAYVAVVMLMLPAFLLIIVGGAVFGVVKASLLAMTGALLGATGAFLVSRYVARDFVARRIARNPRMAALDRVVGEDGRRLVLFLRLSPVVPFVLSNYALGLTRVRTLDFMVGTIGLVPIVVTYAAYGSVAGALAKAGSTQSAFSTPVLVLGVVATIGLVLLLMRITRRALAETGLNGDA